MLRLIVPGLAVAALAAPGVSAPAPRNWAANVGRTADGAYLVGNPAARVKLVEYISYTCPHCAHFTAESHDVLGAMVRHGSVRLEVRNVIFNALDLAAAVTVRCAGRRFPAAHAAAYAGQDAWIARFEDWDAANRARVALYPAADRLKATADGAGLTALVAAQGVPAAALATCQGDPAELSTLLAIGSTASQKVHATPTFELNGKLVEGATWASLLPMLRAAGAR